jgi:Glycosyl transferase family 2
MLNLLYNLYFFVKEKKIKNKYFRKLKSFLVVLLPKLINFYVNCYYRIPGIGGSIQKVSKDSKRSKKVIVSMTSFPGRINTVWITLESLLRQSYKPDKIILWLSEEQFDGYKSLPKSLLRLQKKGITIRFCEDDLRSHKKYYYAFKEYPNEIIVTVDDDVIYPSDTLKTLVELHEIYPNCICCHRAHKIKLNSDDTIASYKEWIQNPKDFTGPSKLLCPTGVSGVLYPPGSVNTEVFNKNSIKNLCLFADDLWLKVMSLLNNTKVIKSSKYPTEFITVNSSQEYSLSKYNVEKNKNDSQLKAILSQYDLNNYHIS